MKAVFLAAGKGSRLGSITEETPKSLLTICEGKETLLSFNLNNLYDIGIRDFVIITGFMYWKLEEYVTKWKQEKDVNVVFVHNPFWNHCNVLGSFYCSLDYINDDFLYLHADTIVDKQVWNRLIDMKNDYVLAIDLKKCGEEEMKVITCNDEVSDVSKAIDLSITSGEFVGVAKFSKHTLPFFKETAISLFYEQGLFHYMEEVLRTGISKRKIKVNWVDVSDLKTIEIDFIEDWEGANKLF